MKPFKMTLGKKALSDSLFGLSQARIYAVSQDVVDRQAHLLDSNVMALGCWTQRHRDRALQEPFERPDKALAGTAHREKTDQGDLRIKNS